MKSNLYKKIGIVVVVAALSFWFWLSVEPLISDSGAITQTSSWLQSLIVISVLSPILVLALALFEKRIWSLILALAIWLPFLAVFNFGQYYVAGAAIMILFFMYADKEINRHIRSRIKIEGRSIMENGLSLVITPLLIMISFAYYFSPVVQASAQKQELPPVVNKVVDTVVGNFLNQQFEKLPPSQHRPVKNQLVREIVGQFNQLLSPYFKYLPPILAFALFLVLQGLRFIFIWLGTVTGTLIFWFAKKTSFVRLVEKNVKIEELVML